MKLQRLGGIARYALYDAGNSNYFTLVPGIAFPIFFKEKIAAGGGSGDLLWGALVAVATVLAAVLGPKVGDLADRTNGKFRLLRLTSWAAMAGTALLVFVKPGQVVAAAIIFVLTDACYLLAIVLYDSALSDVSSKEDAAMVSSVSWGIGYLGGLIGLLLSLGTTGDDLHRFRAMFLISVALFLALSFPLVMKRDRSGPPPPSSNGHSLIELLRNFMREGARSRMFWAFLLYTNGVNAVLYFMPLYATNTLNYDLDKLLRLFVVMSLIAAPASMAFSVVAKELGHILTLKIVVACWIGVVLIIPFVGPETFPYFACAAAALMGPVQALSRSLFRVMFPEESMSSFFGVQSLAARSSALFGPLLFGAVATFACSQKAGVLSAAALFAAGFVMLFLVPPPAGDKEW